MEYSEQLESLLKETKKSMKQTIDFFYEELSKLRAGKAAPQMLDGVTVDYYGSSVPLNQLATINTPDAKSLIIQPFDKSSMESIEKAIESANMGFNPQNDGSVIRINIPPLTEERRKELVRYTRKEAENAKISVRTSRKDVNGTIRKLVKEGLSEDEAQAFEERVQKLTDEHIKKIDEGLKWKEDEIMQV